LLVSPVIHFARSCKLYMYNVELNGIDRVWKLLNWMPQYILYMTELCKILLGKNWTELIELGWKLDWKNIEY